MNTPVHTSLLVLRDCQRSDTLTADMGSPGFNAWTLVIQQCKRLEQSEHCVNTNYDLVVRKKGEGYVPITLVRTLDNDDVYQVLSGSARPSRDTVEMTGAELGWFMSGLSSWKLKMSEAGGVESKCGVLHPGLAVMFPDIQPLAEFWTSSFAPSCEKSHLCYRLPAPLLGVDEMGCVYNSVSWSNGTIPSLDLLFMKDWRQCWPTGRSMLIAEGLGHVFEGEQGDRAKALPWTLGVPHLDVDHSPTTFNTIHWQGLRHLGFQHDNRGFSVLAGRTAP